MPPTPLTFGSTFAGIGGFDLGLERAGLAPLWQVEIDPHCRSLLRSKFPTADLYPDIRAVSGRSRSRHATLAPVDVLCGGFPCQDLSIAGKRAGLSGRRSGLYYQFLRLAHELRPALVLWENVAGLLTSHHGRDLAQVLLGLHRIGYSGGWRTLDAQHFGVAQRRRRVFGVFARADIGAQRAAQILSLAEGMRGHPPPRRQAQQDTPTPPRSRPAPRSQPEQTAHRLSSFGDYVPDGTASTIQSRDYKYATDLVSETHGGEDLRPCQFCGYVFDHERLGKYGCPNCCGEGLEGRVAHTLTTHYDASEDGTGRGLPLVADPIAFDTTQITSPENRSQPAHGKPCHTLNAAAHPPALAFTSKDYGQDCGPISPTLRSMGHQHSHPNGGGQVALCFEPGSIARHAGPAGEQPICSTLRSQMGDNQPAIRQGLAVRRLTPLECERLQGFPDYWTAGFSDSIRYRMLGNAVAVPVAHWLARRIAAHLDH